MAQVNEVIRKLLKASMQRAAQGSFPQSLIKPDKVLGMGWKFSQDLWSGIKGRTVMLP